MNAILLLALGALAAADDGRSVDRAALEEAKLRTWPTLYRTNDADGLANFLADGFVAMSDDGSLETKGQVVAWLRTNKWSGGQSNFSYKIAAISFYGPDTANVYGVGSFDGKATDGSACRMRYTSANIFVKQGERWRPSFSHTARPACAAKESN